MGKPINLPSIGEEEKISEGAMIINGNISEEELESLGVSGKSKTATAAKAETDSIESDGYDLYDLLDNKPTLDNEAIRLLEEVHNKFAKSFRNLLSGHLRGVILDVEMKPVEVSSYSDFIEPLQRKQPGYIIVIKMLSGKALLHIDLSLAFTILDKLLGGRGEPIEATRELNAVELKIMDKIIVQALEHLGEAWSILDENIKAKKEESLFIPQFVDIGAESKDTVILISFDIKREGKSVGRIQLCIPYTTFQPVRKKISSKSWRSGEASPEIKKNMMEVLVPVRCQIGETTLTLMQLLQLEPGDVILLEQEVDSLAKIVVGKTVIFLGEPGTYRQKYVATIVSDVKEEDIEEGQEKQEDAVVDRGNSAY